MRPRRIRTRKCQTDMGDFLTSYYGTPAAGGRGGDDDNSADGDDGAGRANSHGSDDATAKVVAMEWLGSGGGAAGGDDEEEDNLSIPVASMSMLEGSSLKTVPLTSAHGESWKKRLAEVDQVGTREKKDKGDDCGGDGGDGTEKVGRSWTVWLDSGRGPPEERGPGFIEDERGVSEPALHLQRVGGPERREGTVGKEKLGATVTKELDGLKKSFRKLFGRKNK